MMSIKKFFEKDSVRGPISSAELIAFKHACTPEEWEMFVKQAEFALKEN